MWTSVGLSLTTLSRLRQRNVGRYKSSIYLKVMKQDTQTSRALSVLGQYTVHILLSEFSVKLLLLFFIIYFFQASHLSALFFTVSGFTSLIPAKHVYYYSTMDYFASWFLFNYPLYFYVPRISLSFYLVVVIECLTSMPLVLCFSPVAPLFPLLYSGQPMFSCKRQMAELQTLFDFCNHICVLI